MRRYFIELSSLMGISLGATHCYGTLVLSDTITGEYKSEQIVHPLSETEAEIINEKTKFYHFSAKAGDISPSFETYDDVIAAGKAEFDSLGEPESTLLIVGDVAYGEPQKTLAGPPDLVAKLNQLYEQLVQARKRCPTFGKEEEDICNRYRTLMYD